MVNSTIVRRTAACIALAFMFSSVFASPLSSSPSSQPAATEISDLFKSRIEGCNPAALTINSVRGASDELVAARNNGPMCNYLAKCCAGNTDNAQKCCDGLRKNGC